MSRARTIPDHRTAEGMDAPKARPPAPAPAPVPAPAPAPAHKSAETVKPWGKPAAPAPAAPPAGTYVIRQKLEPETPPQPASSPLAAPPAPEERSVDVRAVMESAEVTAATDVFPGARVSDIR